MLACTDALRYKDPVRPMLFIGCLLAVAGQGPTAWGQAPSPPRVRLRHVHTIVVDPGHGGDNTGCMGYHGVYEKFVTLPIAEAVAETLRRRTDAEVLLTRQADVAMDLDARVAFAAEHDANLFVSIHLNAAPRPEAHGVETFFLATGAASRDAAALVAREQGSALPWGIGARDARHRIAEVIARDLQRQADHSLSERLAHHVQRALARALGTPDRGVKQAPFAVLRGTPCPAIVVEVGFLTHPEEGRALMRPRWHARIADAIAKAIVAYDRSLPAVAPPRSDASSVPMRSKASRR